VLRFIAAELLHRRGRTLALLVAIACSTAAFAVLTGASRTARLQVRGTVAANFRGAYDILVRPRGARDEVERREGLVRADLVAGAPEGISEAQWHEVAAIPGVDLAAPIAPLGYALVALDVPIDVRPAVSDAGRGLARLTSSFTADRGLTKVPEASSYAYVTPNALQPPVGQGDAADAALFAPAERLPDGVTRSVCQQGALAETVRSPWDPRGRGPLSCWGPSGRGYLGEIEVRGAPKGYVTWRLPVLMAAVDPHSETRLDGLAGAVIDGKLPRSSGAGEPVPVLAASTPFLDEQLHVAVERLRAPRDIATGTAQRVHRRLAALPPGHVVARHTVSAQAAWDDALKVGGHVFVDTLWTLGPAAVTQRPDGVLRPTPVKTRPASWASLFQRSPYVQAPQTARDRSFRTLEPHVAPNAVNGAGRAARLAVVGRFDPTRLRGFTGTRSTLQALQQPGLAPADGASRDALGGQALLPDGNLQGYPATTPLLLTTMQAVRRFRGPNYAGLPGARPISALRVRVAGVSGADDISRERVRLAAQRIGRQTGLDVDITLGASSAPQRLALPAGRFGRPALQLLDPWARKGVGTAILTAVDRKSLVLFVLVLVVCGLFIANATTAAIRARLPQLALLRALGWSPTRSVALLLGEVAVIGLAAGTLGALLAWPVAAAVDIGFPPGRALIAVLAAPALSIAATLIPAVAAVRTPARDRTGAPQRRFRSPRTLPGLALTMVTRAPARALLGAASVAVGVAALTLTLSAGLAFKDTLVGSLLGSAVSLDIRTSDYLATAVIVALGLTTVIDVLYLDVRDRATELATLRATGWSDAALGRLVAYEGIAIGLLGGLAGAAVGLTAAITVTGDAPAALLTVAAISVLVGSCAGGLAALGPAAWMRRRPLTTLLAED
jgi:hypothetical protein